MSSGYPKVHVVGSGVYYSYRPITRLLEKGMRSHFRENSSRPREFSQYFVTTNSREDGFRRAPSAVPGSRGTSLPPFDNRDRKHGHDQDDSLSVRGSSPFMCESKPKEVPSKAKTGLDDLILQQDKNALFTSSADDALSRLRRKHPYRLPVENEVTAPHESSVWPQDRPHFDLVSSYDLMVDYLGIRDKTKTKL